LFSGLPGSVTGCDGGEFSNEHSNRVGLVEGFKLEDSTSTHSTLGKSILKQIYPPQFNIP
jgi:hypothetical protein